MPKYTLQMLGALVKKHRGARGLRESAREIKIGPATLMRIENGHSPDIGTFGKICQWLNVEPGQFLGFDEKTKTTSDTQEVAVHLRANQALSPTTAVALSKMILCAVKNLPQITESPEGADA